MYLLRVLPTEPCCPYTHNNGDVRTSEPRSPYTPNPGRYSQQFALCMFVLGALAAAPEHARVLVQRRCVERRYGWVEGFDGAGHSAYQALSLSADFSD